MTVIVTRATWGASKPTGEGNKINPKPLGVAVHWEGPRVGSRPHTECAALVRSIQRFHIETRGWVDVAYSFLVCEHGTVFEGRGLDVGSAANGTTQANLDYYAVCAMVGEGDTVTPALQGGVINAIALCRTRAGDKVVTHSDLFQTTCCGPVLTAWVHSGAAAVATSPAVKVTAKSAKVSTPAVPAFPGVTRQGSRGAAVSAFQARLRDRGWRIGVDGVFGPATESIVRQFQAEKHLVADGVVGPATWAALWSAPVTK